MTLLEKLLRWRSSFLRCVAIVVIDKQILSPKKKLKAIRQRSRLESL